MTIPIQRTYNYDYIYFMFNNMAVVETKANISNIWLIHGLIAIEYFISLDNWFHLKNVVLDDWSPCEWGAWRTNISRMKYWGQTIYQDLLALARTNTRDIWKICWLEQAQRRQYTNGGPCPRTPPASQIQIVLLTSGSRWNGSDLMHWTPRQHNLLRFHQRGQFECHLRLASPSRSPSPRPLSTTSQLPVSASKHHLVWVSGWGIMKTRVEENSYCSTWLDLPGRNDVDWSIFLPDISTLW